jgi:hypothetical protein
MRVGSRAVTSRESSEKLGFCWVFDSPLVILRRSEAEVACPELVEGKKVRKHLMNLNALGNISLFTPPRSFESLRILVGLRMMKREGVPLFLAQILDRNF